MISKSILLIIAFANFATTFGQEPIWTKQTKLSEVIEFEKKINPTPAFLSQNVSLSADYYPLIEKYPVTNPLIVQREPYKYLPVYAEYFYTPDDSIVRVISYDWEKNKYGNFFDKQKMWEEEAKNFKIYNEEYERIRKILTGILGTPSSTDSTAKKQGSTGDKYLTRGTVWETADIHSELSMIFASSTYRVRWTMYWKK